MKNKLLIKKLHDDAVLPTRGSEYSAGLDLYAYCPEERSVWLLPDETVKVPTGIAVQIPEGYFGAVYARSGLATKNGIRPANCVGVIDSDYRGELIVPLHNDSGVPYEIKHDNARIAQLVIQPYLQCDVTEVTELDDTERGDGGFGSTGK